MLLKVDTIARTAEFDDRASSMHLRPWQWKFLLAADGRTPLEDLARACGIDFETASEFVHETEALGLVDIVAQTLEQFRSAQAVQSPAPPFAAIVVPAAPTPAAPAASVPLTATFAPTMPDAPPAAPAAPTKKVSVSFDSFTSLFGETSAVAAAAYAPPTANPPTSPIPEASIESTTLDAYRSDRHDAFVADEPAATAAEATIDDLPFAFETPDHMVPLAERPEFEAYVATGAEPPTHDTATVEPPKKSVSFSLFAPTFGEATTSEDVHATDERTTESAASAHDPHDPFATHDAFGTAESSDPFDAPDVRATDDASRFFSNGHATATPSTNGNHNGKVVSLDFGALSSMADFDAPSHDASTDGIHTNGVHTNGVHTNGVSAAYDAPMRSETLAFDDTVSSEPSHEDASEPFPRFDAMPAFEGAPRSEYGDLFGSSNATNAPSDDRAPSPSFESPVATNGYAARIEADASPTAAAPDMPGEPAAPKDDMLTRHFQVGQPSAPPESIVLGDQTDKANDLTGSLLRALGLKK